MAEVSEPKLRDRARALLQVMTEHERWIYAVPRTKAVQRLRPLLEGEGLSCTREDVAARVVRFDNDSGTASIITFDSTELDALVIEAEGQSAPSIVSKVLEITGFYAQSQLLGKAIDVRHPDTSKALRILAHMVIAWDEDWHDLFLLHLASPDAIARHEATISLCIAAGVARDGETAKALLNEAVRRENFPKLRQTMEEAIQVIEAMTGGAVSAG